MVSDSEFLMLSTLRLTLRRQELRSQALKLLKWSATDHGGDLSWILGVQGRRRPLLGLLHRDATPRNILWNEECRRVMVFDLCMAKRLQLI
jgi:hypothetical protein